MAVNHQTHSEKTYLSYEHRWSPHTNNDYYKTSSGFGCAAYIIKNSNMNYLH